MEPCCQQIANVAMREMVGPLVWRKKGGDCDAQTRRFRVSFGALSGSATKVSEPKSHPPAAVHQMGGAWPAQRLAHQTIK